MNTDKPVVAVVMPCYNEEEALPISSRCITDILNQLIIYGEISKNSFLLCVNDGSKDSTWATIESLHREDKMIKGISLSHNKGHQFALLAGLMAAKEMADAVISIDADLQDDPGAIQEMVALYKDGVNIVYGVRSSREKDTFFKRFTAHSFYKLQRIMGLETVFDHADYRLLDKRALDILEKYEESNLFLRGIIPGIGLKSGVVKYNRNIRVAGESKYPLVKMLSFSVDGITSFTSKPIRMVFFSGLLMVLISILVAIYVFVSFIFGSVIAGWSSIMLSIWFVGGMILLGIGTIGEYIGKIFIEVKHRPRYSISESLLD